MTQSDATVRSVKCGFVCANTQSVDESCMQVCSVTRPLEQQWSDRPQTHVPSRQWRPQPQTNTATFNYL